MLHSIEEVQYRVEKGEPLWLAGSEAALSQLPAGQWIGGTIPYFMDQEGGICSESQIFVDEVPGCATEVRIEEYATHTLPAIGYDAPENGFSMLILPCGSSAHIAYAEGAPSYENAFLKPVVGWISGVHLSQIGQQQPKVFNGLSRKGSAENAVVMHVALPADKLAELDIVNVFEQGCGDRITFPSSGFSVTDCWIEGKPANFARYIATAHEDTRRPLTADYNGSIVNVSVQRVDANAGEVHFYAPVFSGVEYRFSKPVADYVAAFGSALGSSRNRSAAFSCNCILNYIYAELEGKRLGAITGPVTFGEIAQQLLNQTLVRLLIHDVT